MKNPASPIADFYPTTFAIDMEGKRAEWEGVVLICFIDEQRLLRAEASIPQGSLAAEERARNKLGDILIYSHDDGLKDGVAPCFTFLPFSHKIKSFKQTIKDARAPEEEQFSHASAGHNRCFFLTRFFPALLTR